MPWEEFRPTLERVRRKPGAARKSRVGRKPMDAVVMFKTLVLGALYNLSDDQIEYQVRDRLSFMRFPGLWLEDRVPDAKTVWLCREGLAQAGVVEGLFAQFDSYLARQGFIARSGQSLDASIVPVPKTTTRARKTRRSRPASSPTAGPTSPPSGRRKTLMPVGVRRSRKQRGARCFPDEQAWQEPIRLKEPRERGPPAQAGAALHDSQAVDHLLMQGNTGAGVWADAACRSEETEAKLRARKLKSRLHRKGKRGKPLTEQAKGSNRTKPSVRVRVEHVCGAQANDMGGTLVHTIGMVRAKARIGMKNLAYNMRRLVQPRRLNPCPA